MNPRYSDLLKHSGIYGIGQVLSRLVSVAMLPVQTRFLQPEDYGVIAILDLTLTVLAILVSGGIAAAINRHHHDLSSEREQHVVWWTGLTVALIATAVLTLPAFLIREEIAAAILGPSVASGGLYYGLMLATLWFYVISDLAMLYFRIRKWSTLIVSLSMASLLFNVVLNLILLVRGWEIAAMLVGNLTTFALTSAIYLGIVIRSGAQFGFSGDHARRMFHFAWPLVITMLLATAMHQADRYLLNQFVDLRAVGVYSLAYQLGQGVNSLILVPFAAIWGVAIYEIAKEPDHRALYAQLFRYFISLLLLILLGVALFADPLLRLIAPSSYAGAAPLVPIICLAFAFYSMETHFKVPALLAKRTLSLLPANAIAASLNIGLNLWLLPRYGIVAAAWITAVTYAVFAWITLLQNRRIDRYDYPIVSCASLVVGMSATVALIDWSRPALSPVMALFIVPGVAWLAWTAGVGYPIAHKVAASGLMERLPMLRSFQRSSSK